MIKLADKNSSEFLHQLVLPAEITRELESVVKILSFPKGSKIITEGSKCRNIYLVLKGIVRAYKDKGEAENVYAFFKEGDYFTSLSSFINGTKATINIETIEDSKIYVLCWDDFDRLGKKHPIMHAHFYQLLSERLNLQLSEKNRLLNLTATERYLYFLENHSDLVHRVPLGYISAFLGMRQSSLSRVPRDIHLQFTNNKSKNSEQEIISKLK